MKQVYTLLSFTICVLLFGYNIYAQAIGSTTKISSVSVDGNTTEDSESVSVAYSTTSDVYLVVWAGDETSDELGIYGQLVNASTGAEIAPDDFAIAASTTNEDHITPQITYNSTANEFLVVWRAVIDQGVTNTRKVYVQRISTAGALLGGRVEVASSISDLNGPSVVYNSTDNEYLVVYENFADLHIHCRFLAGTDASLSGGSFIVSETGSPRSNQNPRVAWNSANNDYLVVWNTDANTSGAFEVNGQRLNNAGADIGVNFVVSNVGPLVSATDSSNPDLVYNPENNDYLVVYSADVVDSNFKIYGVLLDDDMVVLKSQFALSSNSNGIFPKAAYNPISNRYVVLFQDKQGTDSEIYAQFLDVTATEVGTNDFNVMTRGANNNDGLQSNATAIGLSQGRLSSFLVAGSAERISDENEVYSQVWGVATNNVTITRGGANPSGGTSVDFTVTFDLAVIGVSSSNFTVTESGITGASIGAITGSGTSWTVPVNTGSGEGTIRLDFTDDTGIDLGVDNSPYTSGQLYNVDLTDPLLSSSVPADGSNSFYLSQNIVLTFDDGIVKGTGNITIRELAGDAIVETIDVTTGLVVVAANQVTINPSVNLAKATNYYLEIDATAFDNVVGLSYAGISGNSTLNFRTVDIVINEVVLEPQADWSSNAFNGTVGAGPIDAVDDWIELYVNTLGVDLTTWSLDVDNGNNGIDFSGDLEDNGSFEVSNYVTSGGGTYISTVMGDFIVLGNPIGANNMTNPVKITLKDPGGAIVDEVIIGAGGFATYTTSTGTNNESVYRKPNGNDTDTDNVDFFQNFASLGTSNPNVPLITQATWLDENPVDGNIDRLQLDFNEAIKVDDDDAATGGFDAIAISGGVIVIGTKDYSDATGTLTSLVLDVLNVTGTASPSVVISYNVAGASTILSNSEDVEVLDGETPDVVVDGAAPFIVNAISIDSGTPDGNIDALEIEFSEVITDSDVIAGDFRLSTDAGTSNDAFTSVSSTVSVLASDTDVNDEYIRLSIAALSNVIGTGAAQFSYTSTSAIDDADGNVMTDFGFRAVTDKAAPILLSSTPSDEDVNIPVADDIVLNFSEPVQVGTGNIQISGTGGFSFDVTSASELTFGTSITINPGSDLAGQTAYDVLVDATAVTETAGNNFAGLIAGDLNFTTLAAPPTIADATWSDQTGDGNIDRVVLTFSVNVDITDGVVGDGFSAIVVNDGSPVTLDNFNYAASNTGMLTLNFTGDQITGTGIAGLSATYDDTGANSIVTTGSSSEIVNGGVAATDTDVANPRLSSAAINGSTEIIITFSEPVQDNGATSGDFIVTDGLSNTYTVSAVLDGTPSDAVLELTVADFSGAVGDLVVTYTNSSGTIDDFGGNSLQTDGTGVTIDFDSTPPTMASAVDNGITQIDVTFNEPVQDNSATPADFMVTDGFGATYVVSAIADATPNDAVLEITVADFSGADGDLTVTYTFSSGTIDDFGGNSLVDDATGANVDLDNTAPTLSSAAVNGSTQIDVTFTEPVQNNGATAGDFVVTDGIGGTYTVSSIADATGQDTQLELAVADFSAAVGDLTVTYANSGGSIDDFGNNSLADDATGVVIDFDTTDPTLSSASVNGNTEIIVTFSEPVQDNGATAGDFIVTDGLLNTYTVSGISDGVTNDVELELAVADFSGAVGDLVVTYTNSSGTIDDFGSNSLQTDGTGVTIDFDSSPPTMASTTVTGSTQINLTFNEPVQDNGATPTDFTVTDGFGAGYTVSGIADATPNDAVLELTVADFSSADGDLTVTYTFSSGTIDDFGGNSLADDATGANVDLDNTAPTLSSAVVNGSTQIDVTFSEPVQDNGATASDFVVTDGIGGTYTVSSIADATGQDTQLELTVADFSAAVGDLTVTYANSGGSIDDFGNNSLADDATGVVIDFDTVVPEVISIVRNNPTAQLTNSSTVIFRVTFNEPVQNVNPADFIILVGGKATGTIGTVTPNSSVEYDVQVTSVTEAGDAILDLDFSGAQNVTDFGANAFAGAITSEETYTIDQTAPTVTSLEIFDTDNDGFIDQIDITFSELIDTDDSSAPILADLGTLTLPDGSTVATAPTISDPAGASNLVSVTNISVADHLTGNENTAISSTDINGLTGLWVDLAGNAILAAGDDSETKIDSADPILVSSSPANGAISASSTDDITLTFSENITGVSGNIRLNDIGGGDGGGTKQTFAVPGGISISGPTITINPTANLVLKNAYAIQIDATAVDDLATPANSYAGILDNVTLAFTPDNIQPIECGFNYASAYNVNGGSMNGHLAPSQCNAPVTSISSIANTVLGAVSVFTFHVENGSTGAEDMNSVVFRRGGADDIDWSAVIANATLIDENGQSESADAITSNSITFTPNTGNGDLGDIPGDNAAGDGTTPGKEYSLRIYLKTNLGAEAIDIDGKNLIFTLSTNDMANVDRVLSGASYVNNSSLDITSSVTVNVVATHYNFATQPTDTESRQIMSPVTIAATDINGNRDLDYAGAESVTIGTATATSITGTPGLTEAFSTTTAGVATVDDIIFEATETGIQLQVKTGTLTVNGLSTTFNSTADVTDPTVSAGFISITNVGTGPTSNFVVGDQVIAEWDNTASGDDNIDVFDDGAGDGDGNSQVVFDFSEFGGGNVQATESAGIWTATYTIVSGTIDDADNQVSVTARDDANNDSNGGTPVRSSGAEVAVDNNVPDVFSTSPAHLEGSVATNTDIIITFDEEVTAGIGVITLSTAGQTQEISASNTTYVQVDNVGTPGKGVVTITPPTSLLATSTYQVLIDNLSFEDVSRNPFGGLTAGVYTFTTGADAQGPGLFITLEPPATGTSTNTSVNNLLFHLDFTEAITGLQLVAPFSNITITGNFPSGPAASVQSVKQVGPTSYDVAVSGWNSDGTVGLSVDNAAGFVIQDANTNVFSGPKVSNTITIDKTPPVLTANGLSTLDTTPPLSGTVSEERPVTVFLNGTNYAATVSSTLNGGGTYDWSIADGVITAQSEGTYNYFVFATDEAGNQGNSSAVLRIDLTEPTILGTYQFDTDGDGSIDEIVIYFSESISDATWLISDFTIAGATTKSFGTNGTIANGYDGVLSGNPKGTADDNTLTIEVDDAQPGTGILGTAVAVVNYNFTTGTGTDLVGNVADTPADLAEVDVANPIVLKAYEFDTDGNGDIDEVVVEFSEGIRFTNVNNSEYTIDAVTPTKISHTVANNTLDAETTDQYITFSVSVVGTAIVPVSFTSSSNTVDVSFNPAVTNTLIDEIDMAVPVVLSVNSPTANSSGLDPAYIVGETIDIEITLSESVTVTGTPLLLLETGASDQNISFSSGSPGATLTFVYTVQLGDVSLDLDYLATNALTLNSGTILDQSTNLNATNLTLPVPGAANSLGSNKDFVVDGVLPTFVSATQYDIDSDGDIDEILIEMSENVPVTGFELSDFTLGAGVVDAISDVATNAGNIGNANDISDTDKYITLEVSGIGASSAVTVAYAQGGVFNASDIGGNEALSNASITTVDAAVPRILDVTSASNGLFGIGSTVVVQVVFSEVVNITNSGVLNPTLRLETGTFDQIVEYSRGSGSTTIEFDYDVQEGDVSADLNYVNRNTSLLSNEALIRDAALNTAVNVLPLISGGNDLGSNNNIVIDGVRPQLTKAWQYDTDGDGDIDEIVIELSEEVDETPTSAVIGDFVFSSGTPSQISTHLNGGVQNTKDVNDSDKYLTLEIDVPGSATVTVSYNQGTLTDLAGNLAASDPSITVDDQASPIVLDVTSSVASTAYNLGDVIPIQVTLSEPVIVTGTPFLTLETGTTDRNVNFTSGSGSSILTFNYTVQTGDESLDLNYLSTASLQLNSGTINDQSLNSRPALLTLPALLAANSLGGNKDIVIDTELPTITALSIATLVGTDGIAKGDDPESAGDTPDRVIITMDFSDNLITTPSVTIRSGGFFVSGAITYTETDAVNEIWTAHYDVDRFDANGAVTYTINFTDKAGNAGVAVDQSNGIVVTTMTIDNTNPSVSFTVSESPTRSDPFTVTATFTESIVGLAVGDFSIVGGNATIGNFAGSGTVYTFDVNPTDMQTAAVTVRMADEGVTDVAGNTILETDFTVNFDDESPILTHSNVIYGRDLTLTVSQSELGKIYYAIVPDGQVGVTSANIKSGSAPSVILTGSENITVIGLNYTIDLTLPADRTNYDLYLVTEDAVLPGNNLSSPTLVDITSGGVTVTVPALNDFCLEGDYFTLGDIVISETISTDFVNSAANRTLRLELPDVDGDDVADFAFNTAASTSFTANGADVTAISLGYIGTSILSLTYTNNNNVSALDVLTISGLQIKATGDISGTYNIVRSGGNGNIYLANDGDGTVFASLTTIPPYDAPEIVLTSTGNPYIMEIASGINEVGKGSSSNGLEDGVTVYNKADFAASLTPMTIGLPAAGDIVNIYSNATLTTLVDSYTAVGAADTYEPTLADLGLTDANVGITTFWITVQDGSTTSSCESAATKYSVAIVRLSNSAGKTAFSSSDGTGTTLKFTYPTGHTAIYSGNGLTGLSLNNDFTTPTEDGSSIRFIPSATVEGRDTVSYSLTHVANSVTATYSVEVFVTNADQVLAAVPVQDVDYCQYDASVSFTMVSPNGIDHSGTSDGANPDFFTVRAYDYTGDIRGTELTNTVFTTIPSSSGGVPNNLSGWIFDPSTLDGQLINSIYDVPLEFVYFVKDEVTDAEIELATQIITIYREPTVTITNVNEYYCNDDGNFNVSTRIISSTGTENISVAGYDLYKDSGSGYVLLRTSLTADFDPANPDGDGDVYPAEEEFGLYRIVYTSPDRTDAACSSTTQIDFEILEIPALPLMVETGFTGISDGDNDGYLLEYCAGETVDPITVIVSGTNTINWYNNSDASSPIAAANITGTNKETLNLAKAFFGNNTKPTGRQTKTFYYTITDNIDIDGLGYGGCESETKEITIEIYPDPIFPVVNNLVDGLGVTNAYNSKLDGNDYVFEYCINDGQAVTLNDIVIQASLNTEVFSESYYNIYAADASTVVGTYQPALVTDDFILVDNDLKSNYFTYSGNDSTQLIFYISQVDFDNNYPVDNSAEFVGCESALRKFTVDVNVIPFAPDPDDFNGYNDGGVVSYYSCSGDNVSTLTTPQIPTSQYRWYKDDGTGTGPEATPITVGSFNDNFITQAELIIAGFSKTNVTTSELVYTYWVSQVTESNGATGFAGCESEVTQVNITVFPDPVTPDLTINSLNIADTSYCVGALGDARFQIAGVNSNAVLRWYAAKSDKDFDNQTPVLITQANANGQDTVTAEDLRILSVGSGVKYFLVSQENDSITVDGNVVFEGCETEKVDMKFVTINVFDVPDAPTTVDQTLFYCQTDVVEDITVNGESGATFRWYEDFNDDNLPDGSFIYEELGASGTSTATNADLGQNGVLVSGTYKYLISQTQDIGGGSVMDFPGCESAFMDIEITIYDIPAAPVATDPFPQCELEVTGSSTNIKYSGVTTSAGTTTQFVWYDGNMNPINPKINTITPTAELNYIPVGVEIFAPTTTDTLVTFYVSQVTNIVGSENFDGCESALTKVQVVVYPEPAAPSTVNTADQYVFCENDDINVTIDIFGADPDATYTWYSNNNSDIATRTTLAMGPKVNILDSLEGKRFKNKTFSIDNIITNQTIYTFYVSQTTNALPGKSFTGCESDLTEVQIIVNPKPESVANFVGLNTKYCYDDDIVTISDIQVTVNGNSSKLSDYLLANSSASAVFSIISGATLESIDNNNGTFSFDPSELAEAVGEGRLDNDSNHEIQLVFISEEGCEETYTRIITIEPQPYVSFQIERNSVLLLAPDTLAKLYYMSVGDADVTLQAYSWDVVNTLNVGLFDDGAEVAVGNTSSGKATFDPFGTDGLSGAKQDLYSAAETFEVTYLTDGSVGNCDNSFTKSITVLPIKQFQDYDPATSTPVPIDNLQACKTQDIILEVAIDNLAALAKDANGTPLTIDDINFEWTAVVANRPPINLTEAEYGAISGLKIEPTSDTTSHIIFRNALSDDFSDPQNEPYPRLTGNVTFTVVASYSFNTGLAQGDVTLKTTSVSQTINIGDAPQPKFRWENSTENSPDLVFYLSDLNTNDIPLNDISFSIKDSQNNPVDSIGRIFGQNGVTYDNIRDNITLSDLPLVNSLSAGEYKVTLVYNSNSDCDATEVRYMTINELIAIPKGGAEAHDFEDDSNGWYINDVYSGSTTLLIKEGYDTIDIKTNQSWEIGSTDVFGRIVESEPNNKFWITNVDGGYLPSEQSWVFSPTYNLSELSLPTVSFNYGANLDVIDGVVLQYSTDDGNSWHALGTYDVINGTSGKNWMNGAGMSGNPGNYDIEFETSGLGNPFNTSRYGWTFYGNTVNETSKEWRVAAHKLDEIAPLERSSVRFRFALGADIGIKDSYSGFAFDNFKVYDREKLIIVEQFSSLSNDMSKQVSDTITTRIAGDLKNDALMINYFSGLGNTTDVLYERNKNDPGARAVYYGISSVPKTVISGSKQVETKVNATAYEKAIGWNVNDFNQIALDEPAFTIGDIVLGGSTQEVEVISASFTPNFTNADPDAQISFRFAIVEDVPVSVLNGLGSYNLVGDTVRNVLRKMLPTSGGFTHVGAWTKGDAISGLDFKSKWGINNVYNASKLKLIVFVQLDTDLPAEGLAKGAILQARKIKIDPNKIVPTKETITGVSPIKGDEFSIYPNPTDHQFEIELKQVALQDMNWVVYDQAGREISKGLLTKGSNKTAVSSRDLPSGMYMIHVYNENVRWIPKRIIVLH